jgi:hypothetical protein
MLLKRREVLVSMQKGVIVGDAVGGDQHIDGLTHGDPLAAQSPKVLRGANGQVVPYEIHARERIHQLSCAMKIRISIEALQQLRQDKIYSEKLTRTQQFIEPVGLGVNLPVEVFDPDRGVDENHEASAIFSHGLKVSLPGKLSACRTNALLALHLDHEPKRILDHSSLGANTGQAQGFCHQFLIDDNVGAHG